MQELASRRAHEHLVIALAGLTSLAIIVAGFGKSYFAAGMLLAPLPNPWVHVHALLFVGWALLLLLQISFVVVGRIRWHQRLGTASGVWALAMLIIAPPVLVMAVRRPGAGVGALEFVGDIGQLIVFGVLVGRALWLRHRDPFSHKRLMLLATATLMLPALARWPWQISLPQFLLLYMAGPLLLIAWDLWSRHRVHRATVLGSALMVALFGATLVLAVSPVGRALVHWVRTA